MAASYFYGGHKARCLPIPDARAIFYARISRRRKKIKIDV